MDVIPPLILLVETTMPNPYLPPETLDHIVGLLHDKPATLKKCCFLSKPWDPRTRKHLFAEIMFLSEKVLKSWMRTFPDPSDSPGSYPCPVF